jgi:hypothetical protein
MAVKTMLNLNHRAVYQSGVILPSLNTLKLKVTFRFKKHVFENASHDLITRNKSSEYGLKTR